MDLNNARYNMVHQQVQPWDVSNPKILELLLSLPRERFVPKAFQKLAFSDTLIPIGFDQVMLPPKIVGRILQELELNEKMTVLEIGTGTGYLTALLAKLVKRVVSIEIFPELSNQAQEQLYGLKINNVQLEVGDAVNGWPDLGPYDAIIFTGSLISLPAGISQQLTNKGKIFAILGLAPAMTAVLITRQSIQQSSRQIKEPIKDQWTNRTLFETVIPPLLNATEPKGFIF